MRVTQTDRRLVATDTPGAIWLLGLVFTASGLLVLSIPLFAASWPEFGFWEHAAVLAIGVSHLAGGLYTVRAHAATRTELDRATDTGRHRVRRPGARMPAVTTFSLSDVREVELTEERDTDGEMLFQLRLVLQGGSVLPLQAYTTLGEHPAREHAELIRGFLRLRQS